MEQAERPDKKITAPIYSGNFAPHFWPLQLAHLRRLARCKKSSASISGCVDDSPPIKEALQGCSPNGQVDYNNRLNRTLHKMHFLPGNHAREASSRYYAESRLPGAEVGGEFRFRAS
jgi:hypothetical protein